MAEMNWRDFLGWSDADLADMRLLAYSYIQQGIYETALVFLEGLTVLSPDNPYDLQTLGAIHLQLGHGLKALDYLDRALKLNPTHLPTQLNRAKTLFLLGYKRQGLAQAASLQSAPDPFIADQASALLLGFSV